jgi:hypothetical protein
VKTRSEEEAMWHIVDDERRGIHPQPPSARRVPGGVGQLWRCFSSTMWYIVSGEAPCI